MKVGDLVGYNDGDIGIIMEVSENPCGMITDYFVRWANDLSGWHEECELEVLCK